MKMLKALAVTTLLAATFAGGYLARAARPAPPTAANAAPHARRILYWVDPMHPSYKSDQPGIAPDCGMELEPVYADDDTTGTSGTAISSSGATMPPDAIHITPERQQMIGVRFATVERTSAARTIRAVGKVAADERRVGHVHTRVDGWIEKVFADFTGDIVKTGQPMLTIYSPEMLASQQELLLAARARDLMRANPLASAAEHGDALFEAARRRLQLWELGDDQIEQVLRTGEPIHGITVRAPMSGIVTTRNAFPNQKVTADTDLYTITDLSHVWIIADVFESDAASIKAGDMARLAFSSAGTPTIAAAVAYIQPQVDPTTRTLQVRLDAPNPMLRMKPDMFVSVEIGAAAAPRLTVPADAVLDSGEHQTVFVDLGHGYLQPRRVVTGERAGDRIAITSGLSAGERVVASGTFLVDSESQLRSATAAMGAHDHD